MPSSQYKTLRQQIGQRIKTRREHLKRTRASGSYTQDAGGSVVGVERASYAHYETGRSNIELEALVKISEWLEVPVSYLFGEVDRSVHLDNDLVRAALAVTEKEKFRVLEILRAFTGPD